MARKIDTLGKAARDGMVLRVDCTHCANSGFFRASDLAGLRGPHVTPESLSFRCRRCGRKRYNLRVLEVDYDRRPNMIVWVPQRFR